MSPNLWAETYHLHLHLARMEVALGKQFDVRQTMPPGWAVWAPSYALLSMFTVIIFRSTSLLGADIGMTACHELNVLTKMSA